VPSRPFCPLEHIFFYITFHYFNLLIVLFVFPNKLTMMMMVMMIYHLQATVRTVAWLTGVRRRSDSCPAYSSISRVTTSRYPSPTPSLAVWPPTVTAIWTILQANTTERLFSENLLRQSPYSDRDEQIWEFSTTPNCSTSPRLLLLIIPLIAHGGYWMLLLQCYCTWPDPAPWARHPQLSNHRKHPEEN